MASPERDPITGVCLGAEPPAGVHGAEPLVGDQGRSPLKLHPFCILGVQMKPQLCHTTEKQESITLLLIVHHVLPHKLVTSLVKKQICLIIVKCILIA